MCLGNPRSLSWPWLEPPLLVPSRASPGSAWSPRATHGMTMVSLFVPGPVGNSTADRHPHLPPGGWDRSRHLLPVAVSLGMLPLHSHLDTARPLPPAVNTFINH